MYVCMYVCIQIAYVCRYNVKRAWGVRYGWRGFADEAAKDWLELTQETVMHIHKDGGSVLGYSTDPCNVEQVYVCIYVCMYVCMYHSGDSDAHP
jgi:hypothetical protein